MAGDRTTLSELEQEHILRTLRRCRGNRTHAAKSLGISLRGLRIKLATYAELGVEVPPPAEHHGSTNVSAGAHRPSKKQPIANRAVASPALDTHVRKQLGLSLRIFYDAVLCGPLPERSVELATRASERLPDCPALGIRILSDSPNPGGPVGMEQARSSIAPLNGRLGIA
jgi:hypothetical protein